MELSFEAQGRAGFDVSITGFSMAQATFRVDEGYSEFPVGDDDDGSQGRTARRQSSGESHEIPAWMLNLPASVREDLAYKLIRTLPMANIASVVERLIPILHLDFANILPSEITLHIFSFLDTKSLLNASLASKTWRKYALEPDIWKLKYLEEGWDADFEEATRFERDIAKAAEDQFRAEVEAKRLATESDHEGTRRAAKKVKRSRPPNSLISSESLLRIRDQVDMATSRADASHAWPSSATEVAGATFSDDDDMYPSPMLPGKSALETVEFTPALVTSDWRHPRLNWLFLYKNRRKLEENWRHSRSSTFQIPHPEFPQEGHLECIYTLQYSSKHIVSGSRDRTIRVWDLHTRRLRGQPLEGHDGSVLCLQFDDSDEEDIIISGSSDSSVIIWRFSTGQILRRIKDAHTESVLNLRFNKKYLVTCSKDKVIKVWNRNQLVPHHPDYPYSSRHIFGSNAISSSSPALMAVQDPRMYGISRSLPIPYAKTIEAYSIIQVFNGHNAAVNSIQLHGDEIVSASGDRSLKVWNIREGNCAMTLTGHRKGIACVQYDGKNIVSGSSDCTVRVFSREKGTEIAKLEGHKNLVRTVQARVSGPDDSQGKIISGSYDEDIRIWTKKKGKWVSSAVLRQSFRPTPSQSDTPTMPATNPAASVNVAPNDPNGHAAATAIGHPHLQPHTHAHAAPSNIPLHTLLMRQQGAIRVFKLQFDARLIICCSQDSRISGWDFAMGDPEIIESSRFFK